jgi:hypothetical protein
VGKKVELEFIEGDGTLCRRISVFLYQNKQGYGAYFIPAGEVICGTKRAT